MNSAVYSELQGIVGVYELMLDWGSFETTVSGLTSWLMAEAWSCRWFYELRLDDRRKLSGFKGGILYSSVEYELQAK